MLPFLLLAGPSPELEAALVEIVQGARPCRQLRIQYHDGSEALGHTTVRIQGGYARVVRQQPDGTRQEFRGGIGRRGCQRLARQLVQFPFSRRKPSRKRALDDETRPELIVRVDGTPRLRVRHFGFDVQNDPAFAVLRGEMIRVARVLSGGAVRY